MRDRGLIDRLYREHNDALLRYAQRFRTNWRIAEDVVQRAWVLAVQAGEEFLISLEKPRAMLYTFVRRAFTKMQRVRQIEMVSDDKWPDIEMQGDQDEVAESVMLRRSVERMTVVYGGNREEPASDRTKEIVRLHLADLDNKDIAQAVGVSHQAVPQALNVAIKALRRQWRIEV